jgi:hypothetical protein
MSNLMNGSPQKTRFQFFARWFSADQITKCDIEPTEVRNLLRHFNPALVGFGIVDSQRDRFRSGRPGCESTCELRDGDQENMK